MTLYTRSRFRPSRVGAPDTLLILFIRIRGSDSDGEVYMRNLTWCYVELALEDAGASSGPDGGVRGEDRDFVVDGRAHAGGEEGYRFVAGIFGFRLTADQYAKNVDLCIP